MTLPDPPSLRLRMSQSPCVNLGEGLVVNSEQLPAQEQLTRNVRRLLEFTRNKQSDLAQALGVTQGHVSLLLSGQRQWQVDMLDVLARFFVVSVPALFIAPDRLGGDRRRIPDRRTGHDRRAARSDKMAS